MRPFDSVLIVDWSAGNDRGPRPKPDAIWTAAARGGRVEEPVYHRNRVVAEAAIAEVVAAELAAGRRLFLGFDFPFGYPAGFAARLVGRPDPLALWDWFAAELTDTPRDNDRFALAARINARFPGKGPFWFNGLSAELPGLPRRKPAWHPDWPAERRRAERAARGAFPLWQMGGAGAVGGQAMTGMAALARLRARFPGRIAAWPFEPLDRPVALVEVWPSLHAAEVAAARREGEIKDAAQVRVLAGIVAALAAGDRLAAALAAPAETRQEEGWIFGLGAEDGGPHPPLRIR
jgi:molybdopterin molybdotransferase